MFQLPSSDKIKIFWATQPNTFACFIQIMTNKTFLSNQRKILCNQFKLLDVLFIFYFLHLVYKGKLILKWHIKYSFKTVCVCVCVHLYQWMGVSIQICILLYTCNIHYNFISVVLSIFCTIIYYEKYHT